MNLVSNTANSKESMHVKYDMSSIKYKMWLQFAIHATLARYTSYSTMSVIWWLFKCDTMCKSQLKKKDIALCYNVAYL